MLLDTNKQIDRLTKPVSGPTIQSLVPRECDPWCSLDNLLQCTSPRIPIFPIDICSRHSLWNCFSGTSPNDGDLILWTLFCDLHCVNMDWCSLMSPQSISIAVCDVSLRGPAFLRHLAPPNMWCGRCAAFLLFGLSTATLSVRRNSSIMTFFPHSDNDGVFCW